MIIAETERLIIRTLEIADAENLYGIYTDPKNMEFMGAPPPSLEAEREQVELHKKKYYEKYGFGLWAAILKENNQFTGRCGLLYQEIEGEKELEIAYLIDHPFWRKGLATEAGEAILKSAHRKFGFKRVVAVIHPQNIASIRVAEKIGMKYEKDVSYKKWGKVHLYKSVV